MVVEKQYRTFWRRFWAGYVDGLVLAPFFYFDHWVWQQKLPLGVRIVWFVLSSLTGPGYSIFMHGRFGHTIGKRLLRVKVTDISGGKLSMGQAFRREALNLPFCAWSLVGGLAVILRGGNPHDPLQLDHGPPIGMTFAVFGLELLSTLGSRQRRAVHDFLAGSVVVRVAPA